MSKADEIDETTRTRIEAKAFRQLVKHLQRYPEVQNIELMNLAYFCRNCMSKWYRAAAEEEGIELDYDHGREIIYGMPYAQYKARYQEKATADQLAAFAEAEKKASV